MAQDWIRWFDDLDLGDVAIVGGKNASLGAAAQASASMRDALSGAHG